VRYISTRGLAPDLGFDEVLLTGLAKDGGLYVPEIWPEFSADEIRRLRGLPYTDLAVAVMRPFVEGSVIEAKLPQLVAEAYRSFRHDAVTPLVQLGPDFWLMELFHGPTLAFKDVAMQLLGRLFDAVLSARKERVTIVGATSGDTGSAAIEACRDREAIDIFILHPKGRTSEVQRRQMTTVLSPNVHNIALEGTFDDCQDLVKAMFNDQPFRDGMRLSAVNSINWARIMAQIVYYFHAGLALGAPDRPVAFAVPTGNFGNMFAGYAAKRMGLPVEQFIVGSNENDILTRFFETGDMSMRGVVPTLSPSMDIQVSSNFERLMFEFMDRDGDAVAAAMTKFRATGKLDIGANRWTLAREEFDAFRLNDEETLAAIGAMHRATGQVIDPHSVIGVMAGMARRHSATTPMVALATAHPAKFPDAVERATGTRPGLPASMADLFEREERMTVLPNALDAVEAFIAARSRVAHEDGR